ncbi:MAG: chemotaxis protein CheW [Mariprofundaceae bacterium]|nr:chemotaxis protein CheW [Mariprofundaceae bacterium]
MPKSKGTAVAGAEKQQNQNVDLLRVGIGGKQVFVRSSEIKEVIRPKPLTPVPMGPDHMIGLANVHGQVVCIIDAGCVTSLPPCQRIVTARTRFLLLRHAVMHVGIWVDEVSKIQQVDHSLLANSDDNGDSINRIELEGSAYELLHCNALLH